MYYIAQTVFTSNDLKHYGVQGMKWGIRRNNQSLTERVNKYIKKQRNDKDFVDKKTQRKAKLKGAAEKAIKWANENPEQAAAAASIVSSILGTAYTGAKSSHQQHKTKKNADKIKAYDDMKNYYINKQNKYERAYTNTSNKYKQKQYEDGYNKADNAALNAYKKSNKLKGK